MRPAATRGTTLTPVAGRGSGGARVVVVGGGFAGIACAARLAKLGHSVTLHEAGDRLGGSLAPVVHDGFAWDRQASTLTLPAVLRDLFRKSGRPLETELELTFCVPGRRHVFEEREVLDLPFGSRVGQVEALTEVLGATPAAAWTSHLDALGDVWEVLRRRTLDVPFTGRAGFDQEAWRALQPRRSLRRAAHRVSRDERLRALLVDRHRLVGQDPRGVPGFCTVIEHLERSFGRWQPTGGMGAVVEALTARLRTRAVEVRLGSRVLDASCPAGQVDGVVLADGGHAPADVVVWTAPRRPRQLTDTEPDQSVAIPAARAYLGLRDADLPDLPAEVFLHGDPLVLVRTGGQAPPGHQAWTVEHHPGSEDVVLTMARRGIDVRAAVVARSTCSPAEIVGDRGASGAGVAWQGYRSGLRRPRPETPLVGMYRIGADVHPGPGLVAAGLAAAQVAESVGAVWGRPRRAHRSP